MDVYKIAVGMQLTGNVDRELQRMLREMQGFERKIQGVTKAFAAWAPSLQRAGRELAKIDRSLVGLNAIDRNAGRWGRAFESRVAAVARSVEAQARRMEQALNGVHGASPRMAPGGAGAAPGYGRRGITGPRSYYGTGVGVYGGVGGFGQIATAGATAAREDIAQKNVGISPQQMAVIKKDAERLSRLYPSMGESNIREQARLLMPNVGGDFAKMREVLPEYIRGSVAIQTARGPENAEGDMKAFGRFMDIVGRSTSVKDTRSLIDGFVKAIQSDPEAIKSQDFVNAAQSAGAAGKGLSADFWNSVAPAIIAQQGGARMGTDVMSALQNTVLNRASKTATLAQYDEGLRTGTVTRLNKKGDRVLVSEGQMVDSALYTSQPAEWAKKHMVPKMVAQGMLPQGYLKGDYSQELTEEQRNKGLEYTSKFFSNRRGANIFTVFTQEIAQLEKTRKALSGNRGTADVLSDQKNDPFVAWKAFQVQLGNLASAVAGPNMKAITEGLQSLTNAVMRVSDWAKDPANANSVKNLFEGLAAGAAALTAAGIASLASALGPFGLAVGLVGALIKLDWDGFKTRLATTNKELQGIIGAFETVGGAVETFAKKLGFSDAQAKEFLAGDPIGKLATLMIEGHKKNWAAFIAEIASWPERLGATITSFGSTTVGKFVTEILSWPARLGEAIVAFGASLVQKLKDTLNPMNLLKWMSFDGGGDGGASIHKASLGGGANDNIARALGGSGGGGSGNITGPLSGAPTTGERGEVRAYLRQRAAAMGIDPNVAERVMKQESGFNPYARNISNRERSYGVFQLNTMGGLGAVAQRQGINPMDPKQWRRHIDFSLGVVKKDGWRQWYGARDVGISRWQGIGKGPASSAPPPTVGPPPKPASKPEILHVNLDGKKMAQVVLKRGAEMARHPTSAGGPDTYGRHHGPATKLTDAA